MVGGKIFDQLITDVSGNILTIKYLVKGVECESSSYCCVSAKIPKDAWEFEMIKAGQSIWWQGSKVYIKIEETADVEFEKVGFSGGDKQSFYRDKKHLEDNPFSTL